MTPTLEQRAEEIVYLHSYGDVERITIRVHKQDLIDAIATALRQTREGALVEGIERANLILERRGYLKGLEEAAKVAEKHPDCTDRGCYDHGKLCGQSIAKSIRALASGSGKEK
jgi:hypothetical protein